MIVESVSPQAMYVYGAIDSISTSVKTTMHEVSVYFRTKKSLDREVATLQLEVDRLQKLEADNMLLSRELAEFESDSAILSEGGRMQQLRFISSTSLYGTRVARFVDDGVTKYRSVYVFGPRGGVIGEVESMTDGLAKVILIAEYTSQKREVVLGTSDTHYEAIPSKNNLLIARIPQVENIEVDTPVYLVTSTGNLPMGKVVRSDANPQDPFATVYISTLDDAVHVNRGYLEIHEKETNL